MLQTQKTLAAYVVVRAAGGDLHAQKDGYMGSDCIIMIDAGCRGVQNDPYDWNLRTKQVAHAWIETNWEIIADGDVVDVEFILGESTTKKTSERFGG